MKVSSSIRPKKVEISKILGNKVELLLRDNIILSTETDYLTSKELTKYTYDEVKVIARNRENIVKTIEGNFDNWFVKGVRIEELENDIKSKKEEIDKLIDGFEQVNVNKELDNSTTQALMGIAEGYDELQKTKSENETILLSVVELYEIIMGGSL